MVNLKDVPRASWGYLRLFRAETIGIWEMEQNVADNKDLVPEQEGPALPHTDDTFVSQFLRRLLTFPLRCQWRTLPHGGQWNYVYL